MQNTGINQPVKRSLICRSARACVRKIVRARRNATLESSQYCSPLSLLMITLSDNRRTRLCLRLSNPSRQIGVKNGRYKMSLEKTVPKNLHRVGCVNELLTFTVARESKRACKCNWQFITIPRVAIKRIRERIFRRLCEPL